MWSLLYLGASFVVSVSKHEAIRWQEYLIRFLTGKASGQLYYILVLFQLVLLSPLIIRLLASPRWRIVLYLLTPIHLAVIYIFNLTADGILYYETVFTAWLLFYLLGLDAKTGRFDYLIERVNGCHVMLLLMLSIAEAFMLLYLAGRPEDFTYSQLRICNYAFVVMLDLWFLKIGRHLDRTEYEERWWYQLGVKLGDASYGIYFCHMAVLMIVTKVLQIVGLDYLWGVYWILSWILTLSVSWILVRLACVMLVKLHMHWGIMALGLE